MNIEAVDAILNDPRWAPRRGWHDDHREHDRTAAYLPAMMQVRSEFAEFLDVLRAHDVLGGKCLQIGMGECDASHAVWSALFDLGAVTIDLRLFADQNDADIPGGRSDSSQAIAFAAGRDPYDLLFIDAGHKFDDVRHDHLVYGTMVRPGGIIAFHDSLKRPGFEDEVDVWRYLSTLREHVSSIGSEVGIAWTVKR